MLDPLQYNKKQLWSRDSRLVVTAMNRWHANATDSVLVPWVENSTKLTLHSPDPRNENECLLFTFTKKKITCAPL